MTSKNPEQDSVEIRAFLHRLLDADDLGLFCSDDVKDEARRLLGLPPDTKAILARISRSCR